LQCLGFCLALRKASWKCRDLGNKITGFIAFNDNVKRHDNTSNQ
jgi:hypothetical protein